MDYPSKNLYEVYKDEIWKGRVKRTLNVTLKCDFVDFAVFQALESHGNATMSMTGQIMSLMTCFEVIYSLNYLHICTFSPQIWDRWIQIGFKY